jgi:D-3-phosphoglycerate dehydrogenase
MSSQSLPTHHIDHLWCESNLSPPVVELLPSTWTILPAATGEGPPWRNGAGAQAMVASSLVRYNAALMDGCPALRIIARTGIGVDNVDLAAATARGIVVTSTPDGPTESTAEHAVAMLLSLAKRLPQGAANLAAGNWGPRTGALLGTEVRGKTLGLVGLGRIGRRVAEICLLAFSMRVLAADPVVTTEQAAALGIELVDLETMLTHADFVSLHAPATPETTRMMNEERLALMKPGSYLLNLARGSLVDEVALLAALESGHLAGAGLDVFDPEPPAPASPLRNHPAVIATPHMASVTAEGRERMERMAVECLLAFARGERPPNVVNPAVYAAAGDAPAGAPPAA